MFEFPNQNFQKIPVCGAPIRLEQIFALSPFHIKRLNQKLFSLILFQAKHCKQTVETFQTPSNVLSVFIITEQVFGSISFARTLELRFCMQHDSYKWIIKLEKCGHPGLNVFHFPTMNIQQLWQLKKLRFWGLFWSYQPDTDSAANPIQPITVQQDSSDLGTEIKRGLSLNIFINPNFHSWKARSCVAECTKAPLW